MPAKAEEDLQRHIILLFEGDFDRLGALLSEQKIKPSVFIRHIVRKYIEAAEGQPTLSIPSNLEL